MRKPLVSCIMPTYDREKYIPYAIHYFQYQNYPNKELVIIDEGSKPIKHLIPDDSTIKYIYIGMSKLSIGLKRNYACTHSSGDIILHWDDDDWRAPDWISAQVHYLKTSQADMTGIQHVYYYSPIIDKIYFVTRSFGDAENPMNWVHGSTLAYYKSFWNTHQFRDLKIAEDDDFIQNNGAQLFIHDYSDGFVCILHPHNTVTRSFENVKLKILNTKDHI